MIEMHSENKKRRIIIIACFLIIISSVSILLFSKSDYTKLKARIGNRDFFIEIADTIEKQQKGLSCRRKLDKNSGMLFVFPEERQLSFWMKNTEFPITIAFLSMNGTIKELYDMEEFSQEIITSRGSYKYALELNKGIYKEMNSGYGDKIEIIDNSENNPSIFN